MSMFLGPIHHLMYNKIKVAAGRAQSIIKTFKDKFGEEAEETIKAAMPDGPIDFGDTPLEELLGDNPIHQFLQSLIDKIETAEASLVTALLYRFPDESGELLKEAFAKHGGETAKADAGTTAGLNEITSQLNQSYLEGMPCDPGGSFNQKDENSMEISHSDCLHKPKWDSVGAPADIMCGLLDSWVEGFAKALNPNAKVERGASLPKGSESCSCILTV